MVSMILGQPILLVKAEFSSHRNIQGHCYSAFSSKNEKQNVNKSPPKISVKFQIDSFERFYSLSKMRRSLKARWKSLSGRLQPQQDQSQHGKPQPELFQNQATQNAPAPGLSDEANVVAEEFPNRPEPPDHWQTAYNKLDESERSHLLGVQFAAQSSSSNDNETRGPLRTEAILSQVVQTTRDQYEEYQKGGLTIKRSGTADINIRDVSQKILSCTLSFKNVITNIVAFDPTGHASSAWAVVSLGLTVCNCGPGSQIIS